MKKSLIALAAALALSASAFAHNDDHGSYNPPSPSVTLSGNATVAGAISNSISASSNVVGTGFSGSAAGSSASSAATAAIGGSTVTNGANINIGGTTDTFVSGYTNNISTGNGSGAAAASGWSDASSSATATAKLPNNAGTITLSGSLDTGLPTRVGFGPDVAVTAGTNQAASAVGVAGGEFGASGHVAVSTSPKGTVSGEVSDVKSLTTYASTANAFGAAASNGAIVGLGNNPVLNAGSQGQVNATGNFNASTDQLGAFSGVQAPVYSN